MEKSELSTIAIGPRIHLKKVERSDYPDYVKWSKNKESIGEFSLFLSGISDEQIIESLDRVLSDGTYEMLLITLNGSNKNIGWIDCFSPDRGPFVIQIGFTIAEVDERGKHLGKETVGLILEYQFSKPNINRVQATADVENFASHRVLRNNGLEREGKLVGFYKTENGFRNHFIFGITRSKWEKLKTQKPESGR